MGFVVGLRCDYGLRALRGFCWTKISFNSILVRLRAEAQLVERRTVKFQFHSGAITGLRSLGVNLSEV